VRCEQLPGRTLYKLLATSYWRDGSRVQYSGRSEVAGVQVPTSNSIHLARQGRSVLLLMNFNKRKGTRSVCEFVLSIPLRVIHILCVHRPRLTIRDTAYTINWAMKVPNFVNTVTMAILECEEVR
jgi:hypothetical protein